MRYLFIDRLLEVVEGDHIKAIKNVTCSEDVFTDHFPRFPLYPGALLIETMAQTGGLLIEKTALKEENRRVIPMLSIVKKSKFRDIVLPGDQLIVTVNLENYTETAAGIEAYMERDGKKVATASLLFTLLDVKKHLEMEEISEVNVMTETLERISSFRNEGSRGLF